MRRWIFATGAVLRFVVLTFGPCQRLWADHLVFCKLLASEHLVCRGVSSKSLSSDPNWGPSAPQASSQLTTLEPSLPTIFSRSCLSLLCANICSSGQNIWSAVPAARLGIRRSPVGDPARSRMFGRSAQPCKDSLACERLLLRCENSDKRPS